MNEVTWAEGVCRRLNREIVARRWGKGLTAVARKRIPYRNEIFGYVGMKPQSVATEYQADLVITEKMSGDEWLPRVIIEGKLTVSAHDALTYDSKAVAHKNVHPYLRYGILIGGLKNGIPLRLYRHGINFDFMIVWTHQRAHKMEWSQTLDILKDEIEASRNIEALLRGAAKTVRCSMVHRKLMFTRSI